MRSHETRSYWSIEEKAEGVFRILCLGDSMTFGAGVSYHETLPYQLEKILNRADWENQIEIINEGKCGYSLYDNWYQFVHRAHRYQPDLLLIILCSNDAEFYSVQANVSQHIEECWSKDGTFLPYFNIFFDEIREQLETIDLPTIIAYYSISENEVKHLDPPSIIKDNCRKNNINFVDLSTDFSDGFDATTNMNLRVSEEDGHPSAFAHNIAASKLARYIVKKQFISRSDKELLPEKLVYERLFNQAETMCRLGNRHEIVLFQLHQLLTLKRTCKSRLRLSDVDLMPDNDFHNLQNKINEIFCYSKRMLFLEAFVGVLETNKIPYYCYKERVEEGIQKISKMLFALEQNLTNPDLKYFPYKDLRHQDLKIEVLESFSLKLQNLLDKISEKQGNISSSATECIPELEGIITDLSKRHESSKRNILEYWSELIILTNAFLNVLDCYFELMNRSKLKLEEPASSFIGLGIEIADLTETFDKWLSTLKLDMFVPTASQSKMPTTCFAIDLKSSANKPLRIGIVLNTVVPKYPPILEWRSIIRDGELHTYRFELPLFYLGSFTVLITPVLEVDIEEIRLFSNPDKIVKIRKSDLSSNTPGQLDSQVLFVPI